MSPWPNPDPVEKAILERWFAESTTAGTMSGTFVRHDPQPVSLQVGESTHEATWCGHCGQLTVAGRAAMSPHGRVGNPAPHLAHIWRIIDEELGL